MAACPSRESLERLLAETLGDPERSLVELHVEQCDACQAQLHNLTIGAAGQNPLKSISLGPKQPARNSDPATEVFFDRLKRIRPPTLKNGDQTNASLATEPVAPYQIEGYEILGLLGRGAAGIVYRARHLKLNRFVALKVIVAGPHLSAEVRKRFRVESQAIARLQHKNIVQIYDVGEHAECPFLSLELVEGGSLADWMAGKPKSANEAASIVATLAKAVEYAHRQGVVHRDLKPGNVLLSVVPHKSGRRDLKIADFGIAKILPQGGIAEVGMTQTGEILGTPAYMAPEQARGSAGTISPATDVYSLGAILYELLTGRPPFQGATPLDTMMQAAWQDPVAASLLVPRVPQDLNTICLKCLEKEPDKRYSTAAELADDLGRFLRNEPIHARPLSLAGHAIRWTQRHRGLAAALASVAFLLVLLTVGLMIATAHFRSLERAQRSLAQEKSELADEKESERGRAVIAEQHEAELRKEAQDQGRELRQSLYFDQMNLASQAALSPSGIGRVREWLAPWANAQPDLRNWEWYYLNGLCHRDAMTLAVGPGVFSVALRPGGGQIAAGCADGSIRIWDVEKGREIRRWSGHQNEVFTVAWSGDGRRVASASWDGTVKLWNADKGTEDLTFRGHTGDVYTVAWSPDGKRLASGGVDQTIQIWDATTGAVERVLRGHAGDVRCVSWSPDGKRIASASTDSTVRTWDAASGQQNLILRGHVNFVNSVAWNPAGTRLASASNDRTAKIWDADSGSELATLEGHGIGVLCVAWSPDGTQLATGSEDQTVKVWSANTAKELLTFRGHVQAINSIAWSADASHLISASFDGTIKCWNLSSGRETPLLDAHTQFALDVAWSPDSQRLASTTTEDTVVIWDVGQRRELFTLRGHTEVVDAVAWSPDGARIASAGTDHTIRIWDASTGSALKCIRGASEKTHALAWSADSQRLASASSDCNVRIWDTRSGTQLRVLKGHFSEVYAVAWSPDGNSLASGSDDRTIRVWDASTGNQIFCLPGHTGPVNSVAWSGDGERIASGSGDQTIKLWNAKTGALQLPLSGHTSWVDSLSWSPDGSRLASASTDDSIKLWDTNTGTEVMTLGCSSIVHAVAWSPNGRTLASAAGDGLIRIYDATAGYAAAEAAIAKGAQ